MRKRTMTKRSLRMRKKITQLLSPRTRMTLMRMLMTRRLPVPRRTVRSSPRTSRTRKPCPSLKTRKMMTRCDWFIVTVLPDSIWDGYRQGAIRRPRKVT